MTSSQSPAIDPAGLRALFDAQHRASRVQIDVPLALRRDRLLRIRALLDEHGAALAQAVNADFGVRSPQLTEIADIFVLRSLLSSTLKNLPKWMKPVKVSTPLYLQPSRAYLQRQPLGVVGVVSPWNYPVQLSLGPVITALAAGNRVMLKPSELTPQTSALLATLIGQSFAPDELCVVQGDGALAAEFAGLPFDHLFFTGSTAVGRKVAGAGRQVALHHRCVLRHRQGRHQDRPRQAAQCRPDLHRPRLRAVAQRQ
jgi:coniferyl-aldehyde dehydrogenase